VSRPASLHIDATVPADWLTASVLRVMLSCCAEANYAVQQELEMIPLMMQTGFKPNGWLGLILGMRSALLSIYY
jgi:hypothetical protein